MSGTEHQGPSVIERLAAYVTGEAFDRLPRAHLPLLAVWIPVYRYRAVDLSVPTRTNPRRSRTT